MYEVITKQLSVAAQKTYPAMATLGMMDLKEIIMIDLIFQ
jgi:hypothetical protein